MTWGTLNLTHSLTRPHGVGPQDARQLLVVRERRLSMTSRRRHTASDDVIASRVSRTVACRVYSTCSVQLRMRTSEANAGVSCLHRAVDLTGRSNGVHKGWILMLLLLLLLMMMMMMMMIRGLRGM